MSQRAPDPRRLDLLAFAAAGTELHGQWPGAELARLAASQTPPQDQAPAGVHWRLHGERIKPAGAEAQTWLSVEARTAAWLTCQRCLQPMQVELAATRRIRFVADEAQAEALDAESEDDVLALPRWLDGRELAEDELILALPLVPRHEQCPSGLDALGEPPAAIDEPRPANPFAVLKDFKRGRGG